MYWVTWDTADFDVALAQRCRITFGARRAVLGMAFSRPCAPATASGCGFLGASLQGL